MRGGGAEGGHGESEELPADRRIVFRMGINLGDVVVDGDDLLGDGVIVAARLEQICEPGGILVSGTAFDQLQGKLGLPLDFTGEQRVKNIARPVRAYRVRLDGRVRRRTLPHRVGLIAALAACLVLALGGVWWAALRSAPTEAAVPSVAVLPFDALTAEPETGRLAVGIADDIVVDLGRFRTVDVIASRSAATWKDKDVREIGRGLEVGHVLQGAVERRGENLRVTATLFDARSGASLWSERWDRPAVDIFEVQTEIGERVVNSLDRALTMSAGNEALRKRPSDLTSYDKVALAWALRWGPREDVVRGMSLVDEAIANDPRFARAWVVKAWLDWHLTSRLGEEPWREHVEEMARLARKAVELDPFDALAQTTAGYALSNLGRGSEAVPFAERAVELAPSYADVLNRNAAILAFEGQEARGFALCQRSLRLNPDAPSWYYQHCGTTQYLAGQYQAMLDSQSRSGDDELSNYQRVLRTMALVEVCRAKDAADMLALIRTKYPALSYEYLWNNGWLFRGPGTQERMLADYRATGLRICATEAELTDVASPLRLPECV